MKYRLYRDKTWTPTMGLHNYNAALVGEFEIPGADDIACFALATLLDNIWDKGAMIEMHDIVALEAGGAWMLREDTGNWHPVDMRKVHHVGGPEAERAEIALFDEDISKYQVRDEQGGEHLVRVEYIATYVCHQHGYQCAGTRAIRYRARRQHA